ncbi:MAG: SRPBCC domain-containing protein [Cohnella sp.]|nr:SRPBCC domain-containing protein [Cohnella sp.]
MSQHFSISFTVDQRPEEAYAAINNVRDWWSEEIEGSTDKLGEFKYRYRDVHRCTIAISELVPGNRVVWRVVDNSFSFTQDKNEWIGNEMVFEIAKKGNQTEVRFTQVGLVPAYECYSVCSDAWTTYIQGSLRDLIANGKGQPNQNEQIADKHGIEAS